MRTMLTIKESVQLCLQISHLNHYIHTHSLTNDITKLKTVLATSLKNICYFFSSIDLATSCLDTHLVLKCQIQIQQTADNKLTCLTSARSIRALQPGITFYNLPKSICKLNSLKTETECNKPFVWDLTLFHKALHLL